jgi:hypothetical protein
MPLAPKTLADTVFVYAQGLCLCSVCVPANWGTEKIESQVNMASPTGISSRWAVSADPVFKDGRPNPCQCNDDASRKHYLLEC